MLGRDMTADERLDMSFFVDDKGSRGSDDGIDPACGRFQYRASPDGEEQSVLLGNVCYTPAVPVTCVNMWKTS